MSKRLNAQSFAPIYSLHVKTLVRKIFQQFDNLLSRFFGAIQRSIKADMVIGCIFPVVLGVVKAVVGAIFIGHLQVFVAARRCYPVFFIDFGFAVRHVRVNENIETIWVIF